MTPPPSIASPNLFLLDQDEAMHDAYEFSDIEFELGLEVEPEPMRKQTRSQSKTKERSLPPAEPAKKPTKVKRAAKKVDPDYEPRLRRRVIHEEPIDVDTDDE